MTKNKSNLSNDAKLPPEIHVNEGIMPRVVNWPKKLYEDYYKICQKLGNSITKVTIALVRNFVNENKKLLDE